MNLPPGVIVAAVVVVLLAIGCLGLSLRLRRRQRLLRDTPTSKARGVFIGLVEVNGTAECERPCVSVLAAKQCVHYHYSVAESWTRTVTETHKGPDGKTRTRTRQEHGWTTVASGGAQVDFYVQDDTGTVLVRPEGAEVRPVELFSETVNRSHPLYYAHGPAHAVPGSDHRRRLSEHGIPLHAPLYIVGRARERDDVVAPQISADPEAPLFLISTQGEARVQRGYAIGSWAAWFGGLLLLVVPLAILAARGEAAPHALPLGARLPLLVGGAYLALWGLGWVWMVFNSLIGLRNRVRQGASLIDVELKRRADLIPSLASAIQGLGTHEREVQTTMAALRQQATATPAGQPGPDIAGVAADLRVVIEKYPALIADAGFARLHEGLIETEQRIELARTYYNDIATGFATRLEQVPDRFVAALAGMRPLPLLSAAGFERANMAVQFA